MTEGKKDLQLTSSLYGYGDEAEGLIADWHSTED